MRSFIKIMLVGTLLGGAASVLTDPQIARSETAPVAKCEHGVKQTICSRCHPKLKPVFKAKGDWCEEHDRAESQCAICHPELIKDGVKP